MATMSRASSGELNHLEPWLPEFVNHPRGSGDARHWPADAATATRPSSNQNSFILGSNGSCNGSFLLGNVLNASFGAPGSTDHVTSSGSLPPITAPSGKEAAQISLWSANNSAISPMHSALLVPTALAGAKRRRESVLSLNSHRSSARLSDCLERLDLLTKDDSFLVASSRRSSGRLGVDAVLAELNCDMDFSGPTTMLCAVPPPPPALQNQAATRRSHDARVGVPLAGSQNENMIVSVGEARQMDDLGKRVSELWKDQKPIVRPPSKVEEVRPPSSPSPRQNGSLKGIPLAMREEAQSDSFIVKQQTAKCPAPHLATAAALPIPPPPRMPTSGTIRLPASVGGMVAGVIRPESKVQLKGSNSSSGSSVQAPPRIVRNKRVKHYTQDVPSMYCHLCSRKPEGPHLVCANFAKRECLKIVCKKCFEKNKWDWARANGDSKWRCCHCKGRCPKRSSCNSYKRSNEARRKQKLSERLLGNSSAVSSPEQIAPPLM